MAQAEDSVFLTGLNTSIVRGCQCSYNLGKGSLLEKLRLDPMLSCKKCQIDKLRISNVESCACSADTRKRQNRIVFFKFSSFTLRLVVPESYSAQDWIADSLGFGKDSIKIMHKGRLLYPIANSTLETELSLRLFDLSHSKKVQLLVVGTRPQEHLKSLPTSVGSNQSQFPLIAWLVIPVAAAIVLGFYWSKQDG